MSTSAQLNGAELCGGDEVNKVAILCCSSRSAYRGMESVELYDERRDARTFEGGMPVVAHPPCRAWSAYTRHQAKPEPGEKALGLWCVEQVIRWGGILEQPAHSRLFQASGLPKPGSKPFAVTRMGSATSPFDCVGWSTEVWQCWWGFFQMKQTWLFFSRIRRDAVQFPLSLHPEGGDKRAWQLASKQGRSRTTEAFAKWLVETARQVISPPTERAGLVQTEGCKPI